MKAVETTRIINQKIEIGGNALPKTSNKMNATNPGDILCFIRYLKIYEIEWLCNLKIAARIKNDAPN